MHLKNKLEQFFISSILIFCGYKMDRNKNYKTTIDNTKVLKFLEECIDDKILKFIDKNYNLSGKIIYLRNFVDSECMIWYNKKECYLVFIGTQMSVDDKLSLLKDLWTDICLGLKSIDFLSHEIKMHSKYIDNMRNENLIEKIKKIVGKLKFKKINICGHSMGCGLGLYTALELSNKFKDIKFNLITLDSPKIGNNHLNKFVKKIKNLTHNDLINGKDIVLMFPFIYPNYLHIACKTCIINHDGVVNIYKNPNDKINIFNNHSVKDHFTYNIIKNLYQCLVSNM
jgi:hypothetical protein